MKKVTIILILMFICNFCIAQELLKLNKCDITYLSNISSFFNYDFGNYTVTFFVKNNKPGSLLNDNRSEEISQDIIVIIKSGDIKPEVNGFKIKNIYVDEIIGVKQIENDYEIEFKDGVSKSVKKYKFNNQGKIL